MVRFLKNLLFPNFLVWRYFPTSLRKEIQSFVKEHEVGHPGEFEICVEGSLSLLFIMRSGTARERARQLFIKHRVWETKQRTGILFYVLLSENSFEIIADEGVPISEPEWETIALTFTKHAKEKKFKEAFRQLLSEAHYLLTARQPSSENLTDRNEISDEIKFI